MSFFRSVGRGLRLAGHFAYAGTDLLLTQPETRQERADWLHRFCARAMRGLGIEVVVEGQYPEQGAVISNHLSYLDIVVFASLHACVFVSKAEIAEWPVVGWMTTMSGTVYVQRGHGGSAVRARSGMQAAADAGLPVVFFPEGTTTTMNGTGLLKFHSGLLAQAMEEGQPVTAACIRYRLVKENEPGVRVEEDVCWGDRPLLQHIFKLLGLRGIQANVRFAERPIHFSSDVRHRKQAAAEAQTAVAKLLGAGVEPAVDVLGGEVVSG